MKKTELEFTKHGIVMPTNRTDDRKNNDYYTDRVWEEYHKIKDELAYETSKRKQLEDYVDDVLKPRIYELETQLERYKKAVSELQKVTDAVKLWSESSAYTHAGRLMGALHEYEANNGNND
jgi:galactokinase